MTKKTRAVAPKVGYNAKNMTVSLMDC